MTNSLGPLRLRERLAAAAPSARPRVLVEFLLQQLRDELGLEGDELHPRSRFEHLGIDSKRALELKELLDDELGVVLRTTLLFDYPTPESLAGYLEGVVFGAEEDRAPPALAASQPDAPVESAEERLRRKLASYDV